MWAHVMWQNHNMEPWVFTALSLRKKAFLIASEQLRIENEKAIKGKKRR